MTSKLRFFFDGAKYYRQATFASFSLLISANQNEASVDITLENLFEICFRNICRENVADLKVLKSEELQSEELQI